MSGADGGVSPAFYRGGAADPPTAPVPGASTPADCTTSPNSSVTRSQPSGCNPPHQTSSLTTASRPGEGGSDRMAAMATALLVVCLLLLALLLFLTNADRKAVPPGPPRLLYHKRPQQSPGALWIRLEEGGEGFDTRGTHYMQLGTSQ
ncbi:unnamed protein product [Gadus morhua 'NCC']